MDVLPTPSSRRSQYFASTQSLLNNERRGALNPRDNIASSNVTHSVRSIYINWLVEVWTMLDMKMDTFFACVNIVDAVLGRYVTLPAELEQLVVIASLFLAAKYHEVHAPTIEAMVTISSNLYSADQIRNMEKRIFVMLGCNINVPHEMEYIRAMMWASGFGVGSYQMFRNIAVTYYVAGSNFVPSVTSTSIAMIVSKIHHEPYTNHFDIPDDVVNACAYDIVIQLRRISTSRLTAYKSLKGTSGSTTAEWIDIFNSTDKLSIAIPADPPSLEYYRSTYFVKDLEITLLDPSVLRQQSGVLGRGASGVVGKMEYDGEFFAIKEIQTDFTGESMHSVLLREISIMLSLDNEYVIKIRHITSDLKNIFFDLGISDLYDWVRTNGALQEANQVIVAHQLLSALVYIHEMGCLHRDIKPANVIVFQDNTELKFVLGDFGSARGCQISLRDGAFTGDITTVPYRAPEILLGATKYNDEVDVWSMLCTLYRSADTATFFGTSDILLFKIFQVLGTPIEETWPGVSRLPDYRNDFPWFQPVNDFFDNNDVISECYEKLFTYGFVLDPKQRPRAHELLAIVKEYI